MTPADQEERQSRKPARDLRLPGSVAEIMASPPGPKIGAFFDLDGTLVAGFTAVILTQERLRRRDMGVGELVSMVTAGLNHQLGRIEFEELIGKASSALRGRMLSDLTMYIGYIMVGFDTQRRALHDYIADTRVIKREQTTPSAVA